MRFIHISDLHIGKMLQGYSLREDQEAMLLQLVQIVKEQKPDAVLIAGDIYDRSTPSGEAFTMFEQFLEALTETAPDTEIIIIAGNHDSPERLGYAAGFLRRHRIHISSTLPQHREEHLKQVGLTDEWGEVVVWLLPFVKPGMIQESLTEGQRPQTTQEAVQLLLAREQMDPEKRHVIVAHQLFLTAGVQPQRSDSEQLSLQIGGLDQVDSGILSSFEYAALGHIHKPQKTLGEQYRYSGAPLQYSVGEAQQEKVAVMVTLREKGTPAEIQTISLRPLHQVRKLEGTLETLIQLGRENPLIAQDYVSITLTDYGELYQVSEQLEEVYPRILEIRRKAELLLCQGAEGETPDRTQAPPEELFDIFYREIWGNGMTEEEKKYFQEVMADETTSC